MNDWNRVSNTSQRLKVALDNSRIKQAELSRRTGLDKGSIHHYLSGRYEPKSSAINKMAIALNVSEAWLWGYDVPMEREQKNVSTNELPLTDGDIELLQLFHRIPVESQQMLKELLVAFDRIPVESQPMVVEMIRVATKNL